MPAFLLPDGLLYLVSGDNFVLGSDALCQVRVEGAGVAPRHVIVQRTGENWQAASLALQAATWHNAGPMTGLARLNEGDVLRLGEVNVRWLPTVTRIASVAPIGQASAVAGPRQAPAWMWLLLGAAVMAALYGSWLLWDRWQSATAVVSQPEPVTAITVTQSVLETAVLAQPGTPPPLYRVVVVVVTATPLSEPTALPSPTQVALLAATATPASLETPTEPAPATQAASPTPVPPVTVTVVAGATAIPPETRLCLAPEGWQQITVKRAQTMRQLAQRNGTTAARLKQANCLQSNRVRAGQLVFVPRG